MDWGRARYIERQKERKCVCEREKERERERETNNIPVHHEGNTDDQ